MPAKSRDPVTLAFLERYRILRKGVKKGLKNFITLPNENNVHNLRNAFRRLNAAVAVIPRKVRSDSKDAKKYVERDRQILKLTSQVRDIDIISERLKRCNNNPYGKTLLISLKTKRRDGLKRPLREARKLSKRRVPSLKDRKLDGWIEAEISKLRKGIEDHIQSTLSSDENLDELHSLRKTIRKLRYTLELLPDSKMRKREIAGLAHWQDVLGDILECHIFETYLASLNPTEFSKRSILEARDSRKAKYRELLDRPEHLGQLGIKSQ
ncbi:MAG: CHAD domain-containing protein [Thermoplasmatales archaeon]|jgi:CHAD domain-containing protein|nr:CHAD domain-containing protein [Thermoplasmatales archaeon]